MQTIRRSSLPAVLLSLALVLSACGGDDDSTDGGTTDTTSTGAGDTTDAGGDTDGQAGPGDQDGPRWSADVTGALEATIGASGTFKAFWSADSTGEDAADITLIGETATTQVKLVVSLSVVQDGGTFDLSVDLGPPTSLLIDGRSWTEDVQGSVTVEEVAADGTITGTFELTALNDDDGTTVTAIGEFVAEDQS